MMKFSCLQENLNKGVQTVTKAIPAKSALPILANILITAEKGRIKLAATNTETTIITHIGASIDKEGSITVPAKIMKDFIGNLPPSSLMLSVENDILHINSENTKSKFNGINADEFPQLPQISPESEATLVMNPKIFNNLVAMVAFSAGTDESRPVFTGVLFNYHNGKLLLAATDGYRLSEITYKNEKDINSKTKDTSIVIPVRTLVEVTKIFSDADEDIKILIDPSENQVTFYNEDTVVATRIIDGQYPDYTKIIPKDTANTASFDTQEFLDAVKLADIFTGKENNDKAIRIKLDLEGFIKISALLEETGGHESHVKAEVSGDALEITFNSRYLLDFLNNIKSQTIVMMINSNISPCVFKPDQLDNFIHVIMPMQV